MEEEKNGEMDRFAEGAVLSIYLWLDGNRRLLRLWRRFGREVLDEAVTDVIEKRIAPLCPANERPPRFEMKKTARGLVESYVDLRKLKYPVTELFWSVVGKIMGWPTEIPPGVRLFK